MQAAEAPAVWPAPEFPGPDGAVRELVNPVTRSMVRFDPPFAPRSQVHLDGFIRLFREFCQAAWMFGRQDPDVITLGAGKIPHMTPEPTPYWVSASEV